MVPGASQVPLERGSGGDKRDTWRRGNIEGSAATDGRETTTSQGMPATPGELLPLGGFQTRGIDFELVVSPASV